MATTPKGDKSQPVDETITAEVEKVEETRSEITQYPGLTNDEMSVVETFEEAMRVAAIAHGGIVISDDFVEVDKDELVGKPFVIMQFEKGKKQSYGDREYMVVKIMTEDGTKAVFTDGSTGICKRLNRWHAEGRTGGIHVRNGLKKSTYDLNEHDKPAQPGEKVTGKGATYYL